MFHCLLKKKATPFTWEIEYSKSQGFGTRKMLPAMLGETKTCEFHSPPPPLNHAGF